MNQKRVKIEVSYIISDSIDVELPEGKTWEDVKDWYVKNNVLSIMFKGEGNYREIPLNIKLDAVTIDRKYPKSTVAYGVDESGSLMDILSEHDNNYVNVGV